MANKRMERIPPDSKIVTTQRISKVLKAQLFIALFLLIYGMFSWFLPHGNVTDNISWPTLLMAIGLTWYIITKIRIWWHHE